MTSHHLSGAIDLGTNTCLLLLAEVTQGPPRAITRIAQDHARVVRLGQGVDQNRSLQPEAIARTLVCLGDYSAIVRTARLDPSEIVCIATSQARDAANGPEFFARVEKETGFVFKTISGAEEAQMSFLGAMLPNMQVSECAVIDIGGGSTELMAEKVGQSLDIGSVRFTERFLKSDPVTDEEFWECQEAIDQELLPLLAWRQANKNSLNLVGVAGTVTTLASWFVGATQFDRERLDRTILERGDVHRMVEELKWRTVKERQLLTGIEPGRADVLLAGALILWRAMEVLDFPTCRVSTRGLRFGALLGIPGTLGPRG